MTIEATLANIEDVLKKIHGAIASGAQVAAPAENPKPAADAKTTKADAKTTKAETKPADTKTETKAVTWKDGVLPVLQKINTSKEPGHGRDGLVKVLTQFGLGDKKIPDLEALGKHAEVLEYASKVLAGTADETGAADDGLGL